MSTASKTGVYFRDSIINILFIVSGVALLNRKAWGRTVGLVVLSISLIYSGNQFAWGLMQGSPTVKAYLVSYGVVGVWVSIWFYILFKSSSKIALKSNSEGSVDEYS